MNDFRHIKGYSKLQPKEETEVYMSTIEKLFSEEQLAMLFKNDAQNRHLNLQPVVYVTAREHGYRFLINSLSLNNPEHAFGLCDYDTKLSIEDFNLKSVIEALGSDQPQSYKQFNPKYPLAVYAMVASHIGAIVIDDDLEPYKSVFETFSTKQNLDQSLSLRKLRPQFKWDR